jgi:hypothetical protein
MKAVTESRRDVLLVKKSETMKHNPLGMIILYQETMLVTYHALSEINDRPAGAYLICSTQFLPNGRLYEAFSSWF